MISNISCSALYRDAHTHKHVHTHKHTQARIGIFLNRKLVHHYHTHYRQGGNDARFKKLSQGHPTIEWKDLARICGLQTPCSILCANHFLTQHHRTTNLWKLTLWFIDLTCDFMARVLFFLSVVLFALKHSVLWQKTHPALGSR